MSDSIAILNRRFSVSEPMSWSNHRVRKWQRFNVVARCSNLKHLIPDQQYKSVVEIVQQFSELSRGWDSYDANQISYSAIEQALRIIGLCKLLNYEYPQSVPMIDGGVALEWHSKNVSLEIEIHGRHEIMWLLEKEGECYEGEIKPLRLVNQTLANTELFSVLKEGTRRRNGR